MLHLRVQGQGEVIRVLLLPLELGRTNLPSSLQVPREREGDQLYVKTEAEGGKYRHLDPREASPMRLADRGERGGPTRGPGDVGGTGMGGGRRLIQRTYVDFRVCSFSLFR